MDIELLLNEGMAALRQGNAELALRIFTQAHAVSPGNFLVLGCCGTALLSLRQFRAALQCFEQAAALSPDNGEVRRNLGVALNGLYRHEEALAQLDRALGRNPGDLNAMNSRGSALHGLARDAEALIEFERVLAVRPDHVNALFNRAISLKSLGRGGEALACFDRVLQLSPGHAPALHERSLSRLSLGQYTAGFRDHEIRWKVPWIKGTGLVTDRPLWLGRTALDGKTIILHGEQGLGDILQFVRYAPMVAARGGRVVLHTRPALMELFKTIPGVALLVSMDAAAPAHDLHCPLMSLPLAFGTTVETIPAEIPYLKADPSRAARWKEKLGPASGPRIGLVWAGGRETLYARARDIPLQRLLPLLELPAEFISLQKEIAETDRATYQQVEHLIRHGESLTDFADTAALVENLDLVIAVDTSVVHLAGALGKPVWLLNRLGSCWRWRLDRSDTPWYPGMRIFRQRSAGDWGPVVVEVSRELSSFAIPRL